MPVQGLHSVSKQGRVSLHVSRVWNVSRLLPFYDVVRVSLAVACIDACARICASVSTLCTPQVDMQSGRRGLVFSERRYQQSLALERLKVRVNTHTHIHRDTHTHTHT